MKALAAALAATMLAQAGPWSWADGIDWLDNSEFEESQAICRAVRERQAPAEHLPSDRGIDAAACNSGGLYYGLDGPPDPERARLCAFAEAETQDGPGDWPFGGRAMLMTIYANGAGVPHDLDLAIRYACELPAAPAESHGRVMHLAQIRAGMADGEFHYCDDITSGLAAGQCVGFEAQFRDRERARRREALTASWTAEERTALRSLDEALAVFEKAVVEGEVDMTGTLRMAMAVSAEQQLRHGQLELIEHLESGRPLPYAASQLRRADDRLNIVYRRTLAEWRSEADLRCCGAPTADGLREAQRAWIRYRDAFLAFAAVRYPQVNRHALAAWLTELRADSIGDPVDTGL